MTKEFTPETLNNYAEKIDAFYTQSVKKGKIIEGLINKAIGDLE